MLMTEYEMQIGQQSIRSSASSLKIHERVLLFEIESLYQFVRDAYLSLLLISQFSVNIDHFDVQLKNFENKL
jgi:hypothetical protein